MFIIEIILTIFAWRKGWRWNALIPIGSAFTIGVLCGLFGVKDISSLMMFDFLATIALIIMCIVKPETKKEIL